MFHNHLYFKGWNMFRMSDLCEVGDEELLQAVDGIVCDVRPAIPTIPTAKADLPTGTL